MQTNFQAGEGTLSSCLFVWACADEIFSFKDPLYLLRVTNKHSTE